MFDDKIIPSLIKAFCMLIALTVLSTVNMLAVNKEQVSAYKILETDTLMNMALEYGQVKHLPDSGLLCLDIISGRYQPGKNQRELPQYLKANNLMANVLALTYSNYKDAFKYLRKASDICKELGDTSAMTLYNEAVIYQMAESQTGNDDFFNHATDSYRKALDKALRLEDKEIANNTMANLMEMYASRSKLDSIMPVIREYEKSVSPDGSFADSYNRLLAKGLYALNKKDYTTAEESFRAQLSLTEGRNELVRYHLNSMLNLAKVYSSTGRESLMEDTIVKAIGIASELKSKDCLLEFYKYLYNYYDNHNNAQKSSDFLVKYHKLKDEVYSSMMTASLSSQRFIDELAVVKRDIEVITERSYWQKLFLILISSFFILSIGVSIVIYRMNLRLKKDNNLLYDKNSKLINIEQSASEERRRLEKQICVLSEKITESQSINNNDKSLLESSYGEQSRKNKFPFDTEESKAVYARFKEMLEDTVMICNADTSLETFAGALSIKSRYLSHIINEQSGCSFPQLLNEQRIKEACRRIDNEKDYGHLTIEAIAESVGFRSRSHFASTFSKYTGLNPSTYLKIAIERRKAMH